MDRCGLWRGQGVSVGGLAAAGASGRPCGLSWGCHWSGHAVPSTGCRARGAGHRVWRMWSRAQSAGHAEQSTERGAWSVGSAFLSRSSFHASSPQLLDKILLVFQFRFPPSPRGEKAPVGVWALVPWEPPHAAPARRPARWGVMRLELWVLV